MKKQTSRRGWFIRMISPLMLALIIFSCNDDALEKAKPEPPDISSKKNPFTVENMAQAFENLVNRTNPNGRVNVVAPSTTHNYVRFAPQNLDQIMLLNDLGYNLWDEPLEEDAPPPTLPTLPDSLSYFYTLIPANYSLPANIPVTVISQVLLFDEDAGDENDPEEVEDPWIPDPEDCINENGYNICDTNPIAYKGDTSSSSLPEDLVKKTTKELLAMGINLQDLYDEAMKLAGYDEEGEKEERTTSSGRTQSTRYYPSGTIRVRDNSINQNVPVKNVMVKARRWFKIGTTYTNAQGYFRHSASGFRKKAKIIVKFKNEMGVTRGISYALKLWEYVLPLDKKVGVFEKSDLENVQFTFPYSASSDTRDALQFSAAHTANTLK